MKKEIKEIRKIMTEVENRLQALEAKPETEPRLWNVDAICKLKHGYFNLVDSNKLEIVADYCNEIDKKESDWHYYPILKTDMQLDVIGSSYILPCPYFNSGKTLKRLICENPDFFNELLKRLICENSDFFNELLKLKSC